MRIKLCLIFCLLNIGLIRAQDKLKLSALFTDHAVLQQGKPVPVWGKAAPLSDVKVVFNRVEAVCKSDQYGKWFLYLPSMNAGGPFSMVVVSGKESLELNDIYIGEVWLASGQSNMDFVMGTMKVSKWENEIKDSNYPLIRFFNVPKITNTYPLEDITEKCSWIVVDSMNIYAQSAVAYMFARELYKDKKVPVGIVRSSWGATGIEAWMSYEMLMTHPAYQEWGKTFNRDETRWNNLVKQSKENDRNSAKIINESDNGIKKGVFKKQYNDAAWEMVQSPVDRSSLSLAGFWGVTWLRHQFDISEMPQTGRLYLMGDFIYEKLDIWLNGKQLQKGEKDIFEIRKRDLQKKGNVLAVRLGVKWGLTRLDSKEMPLLIRDQNGKVIKEVKGIWKFNKTIEPKTAGLQHYYNTHTVLFNAEIAPLQPYALRGFLWYQGENNGGMGKRYRQLLPMLINDWRIGFKQGNLPFLTVQLPNYREKTEQPEYGEWADLREAQAFSLAYPNTGLAVTIDLGEAKDVHPKNKFDVAQRLYLQARKVAYKEKLVSTGPTYKSMRVEGNKARLSFETQGADLELRTDRTTGFLIAGEDKKFYRAKATLEQNEIVVFADEVQKPVAVRYAWEYNPDATLFNRQGLPAMPFRTDDD